MLSIEQKISNLLPISAVGPFRKHVPCAHDCRSTVCLHKRLATIGYTFSHLQDPGGAFWDIFTVLAVHSTTRFSFGHSCPSADALDASTGSSSFHLAYPPSRQQHSTLSAVERNSLNGVLNQQYLVFYLIPHLKRSAQ